MLKKITMFLAFAALTTSAIADNEALGNDSRNTSALIGLEMGSMNIDAQTAVFEESYSKNIFDVGIRLGAKSEDYRFLGIYHILDSFDHAGNKVENILATAHLDYMFWRWDLGSSINLKPFIGANGGYIENKYSAVKEDGFTYGAETGLILDMRLFDVDLGVRYMGSNVDAVNELFNVYIGINVKIQP
jgi:hypothetical protein